MSVNLMTVRLPTIESFDYEDSEIEEEEGDEDEKDGNYVRQRKLLKQRVHLLANKLKKSIEAALTLKNIANAAFIIVVSMICFLQCYSQITEYLKYSTRIQVTHSFPTSTLSLMPGVTVCNNNRMRMEQLSKKIPDLEKKVKDVSSHITRANFAFIAKRKRTEYFTAIKDILDASMNVTKMIYESPLSDLLELSKLRMVTDINCNLLWGKPFNCENFRIIESYQSGPCYTMFFHGTVLEAISTGKAYEFNSSLLGGKRKIDSFNSHEVAEILVDFEPLQHADYQRDSGGKIIIHPTSQVGSVRDTTHAISPGYQYDLIIKRQITKRLPPPYKSMCYEYTKHNDHHFTTKEGSHASIEFDKTTCVRNCIIRQTTKDCDCWPIEIPYYAGDTLTVNDSHRYKMCPWGSDDERLQHSSSQYVDCYKRLMEKCREVCRGPCTLEEYKVHVMSSPWPTKEMFFRAISETQKRDYQTLKGCCARISIKYTEFLENLHIMYPNITLVQLVSNIGGIVSALIGVSTLTLYRYVTRKIFRCKIVSDYTYNPTVSEPQTTNNRKMIGKELRKRAIGATLCKQLARVSPAED